MSIERWRYIVRLRLRSLFRSRQADSDLDEELRAHIAMEIERRVTAGATPAAARTDTLKSLGGLQQRKEETRDARGFVRLRGLGRDVRFAWRILRRRPGFVATTVMTLGLGIGLSTAAYSMVHAVLLTPLPYHDPSRLVRVWGIDSGAGANMSQVLSDYRLAAFAASSTPFTDIAAYAPLAGFLTATGDGSLEITGAAVSNTLFDVLGVRATAGRTFDAGDRRVADSAPVVISEQFARSGIAGTDPLGATIDLSGVRYYVIGIMPSTFWFPNRQTRFWTLLPPKPPAPPGGTSTITSPAVARLSSGVTLATAHAAANAVLRRPDEADGPPKVTIDSYQRDLRSGVSTSLAALQGAAILVLVLVGLNVGWLFLAHARRLGRTFATMQTLGAPPRSIAITYLISALVVAVIATPCAVLAAGMLLRLSLQLDVGVLSGIGELIITSHVVFVAALATLAVSAAASVPGLLDAVRHRPRLETQPRTVTGGRLFERAAMTAQMALVFALGTQALLLGQFLRVLGETNVGFPKVDFSVTSLAARTDRTAPDVQYAGYQQILHDLDDRGIRSALTNAFPLTGSSYAINWVPPWLDRRSAPMVATRIITASFFEVTGLTATHGRLLTDADVGQQLVVVNDVFAGTAPERQVLGQRLSATAPWTIVGVTRAIQQRDLGEAPQPEVYMLYDDYLTTRPQVAASVLRRAYVVATGGVKGTQQSLDVVRDVVRNAAPDIRITDASRMSELVNRSIGIGRLVVAGASTFAWIALLVVASGFHGMASYSVALRQREIGIRMALGATSFDVVREIVRPVTVVFLAGAGIGGGLLWTSRNVIRSLLVHPPGVVEPSAPLTMAATAFLLIATLMIASYRPLRAAAHVDPAVSLRAD